MSDDDDTRRSGDARGSDPGMVDRRKVGARDDGPRKPAGPAPKDQRRETEERLAEATGGAEGGKAKDAMKDDPSLPGPDKGGEGRSGNKGAGRR